LIVITDGGRYWASSPTNCSGTGQRSIVHRPATTQYRQRLQSPTAGLR